MSPSKDSVFSPEGCHSECLPPFPVAAGTERTSTATATAQAFKKTTIKKTRVTTEKTFIEQMTLVVRSSYIDCRSLEHTRHLQQRFIFTLTFVYFTATQPTVNILAFCLQQSLRSYLR